MPQPTGLVGIENRDRTLDEVLNQIANHDRRGDPDVMIADYS
jgi:hypothetical protein